MSDKLDCGIIRDLLPSYVDGISSEETRTAVEAHIAHCTDCSAVLARMKEPEPQGAKNAEVDYLKKVRRHTNYKSLIISIVLMIIALTIIGYRFFYVGNAVDATEVYCNATVDGASITLNGSLTSSAQAVSRVSFYDSNGMVGCRIYAVPKTFFNKGSFSKTYTAASPVEQVRVDDLIIWEQGIDISSVASQLFRATNPYVGDMPANSEIAKILGVWDQFGSFTNELQTANEPYDWMLRIETPIAKEEEAAAKAIMEADSYAMLAVIGNLGSVTWQYSTSAGVQEYTVTAQQATDFAGQDIKQIAKSASGLQGLLQSLSFKWSGVREGLQESGTFYLNIANCASDKIYGFGIEYYLDGNPIGGGAMINADNSALHAGEEMSFDFTPENFPNGTTAITLNGFSFDLSVLDANGNSTVAAERVEVSARYSWIYFFTLTGDANTGYKLTTG